MLGSQLLDGGYVESVTREEQAVSEIDEEEKKKRKRKRRKEEEYMVTSAAAEVGSKRVSFFSFLFVMHSG